MGRGIDISEIVTAKKDKCGYQELSIIDKVLETEFLSWVTNYVSSSEIIHGGFGNFIIPIASVWTWLAWTYLILLLGVAPNNYEI